MSNHEKLGGWQHGRWQVPCLMSEAWWSITRWMETDVLMDTIPEVRAMKWNYKNHCDAVPTAALFGRGMVGLEPFECDGVEFANLDDSFKTLSVESGPLGHVTVSMPSARLALMSDCWAISQFESRLDENECEYTLIQSGILTQRRKRPYLNSLRRTLVWRVGVPLDLSVPEGLAPNCRE